MSMSVFLRITSDQRYHSHRLRRSVTVSTVVTMTSRVNRKAEHLTPLYIGNPENIETKIGVNDYVMDPLQLCQVLWKSVQRGLLPILVKYNLLVTLCIFPFLPFFLVVAYSKNWQTNFHDVYIKRRGFSKGCAFWGFR